MNDLAGKILFVLGKYNNNLSQEDFSNELKRCIDEKKIIYIIEDGSLKLVFCWKEVKHGNEFFIEVFNLWVSEELRNFDTLLPLRSFFRNKYPNMIGLIWRNRRRNGTVRIRR